MEFTPERRAEFDRIVKRYPVKRAVLLPATMKLLGDWNWYLPRWLNWLPRPHGEEPAPAVPATPVSA